MDAQNRSAQRGPVPANSCRNPADLLSRVRETIADCRKHLLHPSRCSGRWEGGCWPTAGEAKPPPPRSADSADSGASFFNRVEHRPHPSAPPFLIFFGPWSPACAPS